MSKRILVVLLVIALITAVFILPKASFAGAPGYDEALQSYNAAVGEANAELVILKNKIKQVREEHKAVFTALKEKKSKGEDIDAVKPLIKELVKIDKMSERRKDIRKARLYYVKDLIKQLKEIKGEIESKKSSGASDDELKPLIKKAYILKRKINNVVPYSSKVSLNRASKVKEAAEKLKNNGKEDKAVKLLQSATKRTEKEISIMKKQEDNLNKVIELLDQIKSKAGI